MKEVKKKRRVELEYTPLAIILRFIFSAIFGGGVTLLIIYCIMYWDPLILFNTVCIHLLWIIPIIWGVIGIFFFDFMIKLSRDVIEKFFGDE